MTRFKEHNINNSQLSRTLKPHHNRAHTEMTKLWENQSAWSSPQGEAVCNWITSWVNSDPLVSFFELSIGKKGLRVILHDPQKPQEHSAVCQMPRGLDPTLQDWGASYVQAMGVTCHELLFQMVRIWGLVPCWQVLTLADTFSPSSPCPFSAALGKHTILISEARA